MIYDCFLFFNELELLEIRLNELDSVVDKFVLVEATKTFQKKEKPLYFELNKKRYFKFLPKITHIIVDQYPRFFSKFRIPKTWDYENYQRDQIAKGLIGAKPDDDIMISDVDEIPKPNLVHQAASIAGIKVFKQKMFYYYLDCFVKDYPEPVEFYKDYKPWNGTVMLKMRDFKTATHVRRLRSEKGPNIIPIFDGGWHYSFLGGVNRVIQKIEAYSHTEHNQKKFKDLNDVQNKMRKGIDIFGRDFTMEFVESTLDCPNFLLQNFDSFRHLSFLSTHK